MTRIVVGPNFYWVIKMRSAFAALILLTYAFESGAASASINGGSLEGYYSSPSKRCTKFSESSDDLVSCENEFHDCMLIRKIGKEEVEVEVFSTQANQHVCALSGIARVEGGRLVYYFGSDRKSQRIDFIRDGSSVVLRQYIAPGEHSENCGAYAEFDGLRFEKLSSDVSKYSCFKD